VGGKSRAGSPQAEQTMKEEEGRDNKIWWASRTTGTAGGAKSTGGGNKMENPSIWGSEG